MKYTVTIKSERRYSPAVPQPLEWPTFRYAVDANSPEQALLKAYRKVRALPYSRKKALGLQVEEGAGLKVKPEIIQ